MAKLSKGDDSTTEIHPDAWERFERAVDVVAKSPPQHRKSHKSLGKRRVAMPPSQVEGAEDGKKAEDEGGRKKDSQKSKKAKE